MSRNIWSKKLAMMAATAAAMVCCQSAFAETVEMDLEDAMLRAFNTNPAVEIAGYEMKSAKASYDAAKSGHFLSVSGRHSSGRGGLNDDYHNALGINLGKQITNRHTNSSFIYWLPRY